MKSRGNPGALKALSPNEITYRQNTHDECREAGENPPTPEVGMGCTVFFYSDRRAATVVRVSESGKTVWIKYDEAHRTDLKGMIDTGQQYIFTPGEGEEIKVVKSPKRWKVAKATMTVRFGYRAHYFDFSF